MKKGKTYKVNQYPVDSIETSNVLGRVEPILTPELLISRYLKSIPEVSKYSNDELKDQIELAMNDVELLTGLALTPIQVKERKPYEHALYKSFIFTKTNHRPIISVESLNIVSSNQETVFSMPLEWLEMGDALKGTITVLPLLQTLQSSNVTSKGTASGALIFVQTMSSHNWIPAFWEIRYTYGLCKEGSLPIVVNQIVGMTAAISILSAMQTTNRFNSQSLSADSISQSSSSAGPQIYAKRIEDLQTERERLMQKIKAIFNNKYYLSSF